MQNELANGETTSMLFDVTSATGPAANTAKLAGVLPREPQKRLPQERTGRRKKGPTQTAARARGAALRFEPVLGLQALSQRGAARKLSRSMDDIHAGAGDDAKSASSGSTASYKLPQLTSRSTAQLTARTHLSYDAVNDVIHTHRSHLRELHSTPPTKPSIPLATHKAAYNGFTRGKTEHLLFKKVAY